MSTSQCILYKSIKSPHLDAEIWNRPQYKIPKTAIIYLDMFLQLSVAKEIQNIPYSILQVMIQNFFTLIPVKEKKIIFIFYRNIMNNLTEKNQGLHYVYRSLVKVNNICNPNIDYRNWCKEPAQFLTNAEKTKLNNFAYEKLDYSLSSDEDTFIRHSCYLTGYTWEFIQVIKLYAETTFFVIYSHSFY